MRKSRINSIRSHPKINGEQCGYQAVNLMHGEMSDKASNLPTVSNWIFCLILLNKEERTQLWEDNALSSRNWTLLDSNFVFHHIGNSRQNSHVIGQVEHLIILSCTVDDYYTAPKPLDKHRQIYTVAVTKLRINIYVGGIGDYAEWQLIWLIID